MNNKQYDITWEGGGVIQKKYHISIEGTGTQEEVLESIMHIYRLMEEEMNQGRIWNNIMCLQGTEEYYYEDDGVLRTEINEVNNGTG